MRINKFLFFRQEVRLGSRTLGSPVSLPDDRMSGFLTGHFKKVRLGSQTSQRSGWEAEPPKVRLEAGPPEPVRNRSS